MHPDHEIVSSRELHAPVETVYRAFADPQHLQHWWGPEGFTNTIHEFNLVPEGKWTLTMHGPEKGHYENASVFKIVEPNQRVAWTRLSQPWFDMEVRFESLTQTTSRISFRMIFRTAEESNKIRKFATPSNEENFDRLERVLAKMLSGNEN